MLQTANERAIADILAQYPRIAEDVLEPNGRLILARQEHILPDGRRSDLVYISGEELYVVELKINPAISEDVEQISHYADLYRNRVISEEFPGSSLRPVLLAPEISSSINGECHSKDVEPVEFDIEHDVLEPFSNTVYSGFDRFLLEGVVTGVSTLHLINGTIKYIGDSGRSVSADELADNYDVVGKRETSEEANRKPRVGQFLRIGRQLNLLTGTEPNLTDRGESYYEATSKDNLWTITPEQANEVINLLYSQPFYSDLSFSITAMIETIFELSKNSRPVHRKDMLEWYTNMVGKRGLWNSENTIKDVVRWIGNFAEELGLIRRVGRGGETAHYITPEGFKLLTSIQIQKGRQMIRSLGTFDAQE